MKIKNVILRKQTLTTQNLIGILYRFFLEKHQTNYILMKIEVEVEDTHTYVLFKQIGIDYKNKVDTKSVRNLIKNKFYK